MPATLSFDAATYDPGMRHAAHYHDSLHLSIVLGGAVAETVGRNTEYGGVLSVVAKDPGVVHADDFGPTGARLARLVLPAGTIGDLVDDRCSTAGWRWTHDASIARSFIRLARRARNAAYLFRSDDADLVDLLAAFTATPARPARGRPPLWLEQTMLELRESWTPSVTVAAVARRAGVHPVYLARVVRRWYGTSVSQEMRRLRFSFAASSLVSTTDTVSSVAHASGYADHAHLCRDFRRVVLVTPANYRALAGETN